MIVDLSGYSFTGKSAVYDLLLEFEGVASFGKEFEFDLIRMPGGILDLDSALTQNWSPVRSSESIRRFQDIVANLSGNESLLSRLTTLGTHYDAKFAQFQKCSMAYISELTQASWESSWPFAYYGSSSGFLFLKKLVGKLSGKDSFRAHVFLSRMDENDFVEITKSYMESLFSKGITNECSLLVLNNAFEPFYPEQGMRYFHNAKSIVVDRDPRDVYLSALRQGKVGKINVGEAVLGKSVDDFIVRYQTYRSPTAKTSSVVLRVNFESLVKDYDATTEKIVRFLDIEELEHIDKGKIFNPELSKKRVGQWHEASKVEIKAISEIENQLSEYCTSE